MKGGRVLREMSANPELSRHAADCGGSHPIHVRAAAIGLLARLSINTFLKTSSAATQSCIAPPRKLEKGPTPRLISGQSSIWALLTS